MALLSGLQRPDSAAGVAAAGVAAARRVGTERAQQIDAPEAWPVHVAEVKLGGGGLPEQEVGQPLLAAGPDDEVRVGLAACVQVPRNVLVGQRPGKLACSAASACLLVQQ